MLVDDAPFASYLAMQGRWLSRISDGAALSLGDSALSSHLMLSLALASLSAPATEASADWKIKKLEFSAVSIGVAMKDHTTGWSSFTNGAQAIKITKTREVFLKKSSRLQSP